MKTTFLKFAVTTMLGLSSLSALAAPAFADSLSVGLTSGVVDVQYRDNDRRWDNDGRGRDRHGRDWDRRDNRRVDRGCAPGLAADKARAFGLRRAEVVDVTPRRVVVEGSRHGDYRRIVFANLRGCPIIR